MSVEDAEPKDPNIGRVLSEKYELLRLLGKGGMGAVYEGRNQIGKRVAVKLLLDPTFSANRELTTRFFREAQASAAVESKHVVDVYDTGVDAATGFPFIIMAYLPGEDLEHVIRRLGALNPIAATRIVSQAAAGIAKAHAAGIVHRDLKPANLFLATDDGEYIVKVLDFGIAKVDASLTGGEGLTQTGALLGTPLYMSPEQAQGFKTVDARTDVWSLGMCLYHALAGRLPFDDVDTIGKLIVAIVARDLTPLATLAPWVNPDLAAVVHRALQRGVDDRIQSARELIAALNPHTQGSPNLTAGLLVGMNDVDVLGATLAPGVDSGSHGRATPPSPGARTTGGIATDRERALQKPQSRRVLWAITGAVGVVAAAIVAVKASNHSPEVPALTSEAPSQSVVTPPAHNDAPPIRPQDDGLKTGVLTLKIPDGYTVKVDGALPGPGNASVPRPIDHGRLELHGEFQQKFLVAVHDRSGARVMVQDVYLYDNKLDPEVIDSKTGPVKVDKPKHGVDASAPALAPSSSTSDLPPRF